MVTLQSPVKPHSSQWREIYLCVALTTMATLLLELSLTRIFSVVFYYHFAFLAISIALFGLGLGGVFSYVVAGWKAPLFTRLGRLSVVNSLLVIVALAVLLAQGDNRFQLGPGAGLLHDRAAFLHGGRDRLAGHQRDHRAGRPGLLLRPGRRRGGMPSAAAAAANWWAVRTR